MPNLATWFTPSLQTISRSAGRSSVIAAAYRACTKLTDERLGITRDFTPKGKHGLAGNICIGIPNDDIQKLWSDAEKSETRANSTVARELMVPLPSAWSDAERAKCVRGLGEMLRARYGVAVLASIHRPSKDNNNEHVHIMFTTRTVDANGVFGKKTRILDDAKTGEVKKLREAVCEIVNAQAIEQGDDWYVYAGKFAEIMEDHIPTTHISIAHGKNQEKYIEANREQVSEAMAVISKAKARVVAIEGEIADLQRMPDILESSQNTPLVPDVPALLDYAPPPEKKRLEYIMIPCGAQLATEQLENAYFKLADRRRQLDDWKKYKKEIVQNTPTPQYNFFGWPSKSYKMALVQHGKDVETAKAGVAECVEKISALRAYIDNPERKRLAAAYHTTREHNTRVDEELKQMAADNLRATQMSQQNVDWSARLEESRREMDARQVEAVAYGNDNSGYGM